MDSPEDRQWCGVCERVLTRRFSPTTNLRLAEYCKRENEDGRARQRLWMDRPDVREKIRSGVYEPDTGRGDSLDGPENSSSILTRLEEGLPVAA